MLSGSVVCDVGGGNGFVMLELIKQQPHLKAIVQDLSSVLEDGKKVGSLLSESLSADFEAALGIPTASSYLR